MRQKMNDSSERVYACVCVCVNPEFQNNSVQFSFFIFIVIVVVVLSVVCSFYFLLSRLYYLLNVCTHYLECTFFYERISNQRERERENLKSKQWKKLMTLISDWLRKYLTLFTVITWLNYCYLTRNRKEWERAKYD